MTNELAAIDIAAAATMDAVRAALREADTAEDAFEINSRIHAAKAWAKAHGKLRDYRAQLLRLEVEALVRVVQLGGEELLSGRERIAAVAFAAMTPDALEACLADMGAVSTAAGLYQRFADDRDERQRRAVHVDMGRQWASGERESVRSAIEDALGDYSRFGTPFEVADIADRVIDATAPTADDFMEGVREMCRSVLRKSPSRLVDGTIIPKFITSQLPDGSWVRVPTINATYADVTRNLQMREDQLRQDQAALDRFREFVRRVAAVSTDPAALVADILADSIKKDAAA